MTLMIIILFSYPYTYLYFCVVSEWRGRFSQCWWLQWTQVYFWLVNTTWFRV